MLFPERRAPPFEADVGISDDIAAIVDGGRAAVPSSQGRQDRQRIVFPDKAACHAERRLRSAGRVPADYLPAAVDTGSLGPEGQRHDVRPVQNERLVQAAAGGLSDYNLAAVVDCHWGIEAPQVP